MEKAHHEKHVKIWIPTPISNVLAQYKWSIFKLKKTQVWTMLNKGLPGLKETHVNALYSRVKAILHKPQYYWCMILNIWNTHSNDLMWSLFVWLRHFAKIVHCINMKYPCLLHYFKQQINAYSVPSDQGIGFERSQMLVTTSCKNESSSGVHFLHKTLSLVRFILQNSKIYKCLVISVQEWFSKGT